MGKRELLLVLGLIVAGAAVYYATAPPPAPGAQEFSVSRLLDLARRHVGGNRASAEGTTAATFAVSAATTELRFSSNLRSLTIIGADRRDVASELHVSSTGYDDAEAHQLVGRTVLKVNEAGGRLLLSVDYPPEARQQATLVLRVPQRLRVSIARFNGELDITNTADVELLDTRGEAKIHELVGRLSASHRGGDLTITDVAALKLTVRGADVRLSQIRGDVTVQAQAGELEGQAFGGAIDIEANGTEVSLAGLETTSAPIHVTATNGSVKLDGVSSETRIDGRNASIDVSVAQAAPLAIYGEGDEEIEVGPARDGYQIDAAATAGGAIRLPAGFPNVTIEGQEQRASGPVHGGGPTLILRATSGDIILRTPGTPRRPIAPPPPPAAFAPAAEGER